MQKLTTFVAAVVVALAVSAAATASPTPATVDFGACAFGSGTASVPAGVPIVLQDTGGFASGNYGTALNLTQKATATATITEDGSTTVEPLALSGPTYLGAPFFAWLTFVSDVNLDPLASGDNALVTVATTNTGPGEAVFPGQKGPNHFGPFHIAAGETFENSCLITAS